MITIEQGYCMVYDFLVQYWQTVDKHRMNTEDNAFTLVTIISTMDPERKIKPTPIDPSKYEDWKNTLKQLYPDKSKFSSEEIFNGMIRYLKKFKQNYHFSIQEVIDDISENIHTKYQGAWDSTILNNVK